MKQHILILTILCLAVIGCDGESNSLYNPDYEPERPDPVVNSIDPEQGYLAGVDEIIISGENFSPTPEENLVYFDGTRGIVHSATETELVVRPARVVGEDVLLKVSVHKAINFSEPIPYRLDQAVFEAPGSIENDNTLGITVNAGGDIIYSNQQNGIANGIRVWRTDGTVELYLSSSFNWTSLKVGPDGLIYGARDIFGVYRETPDGTIDNNPFAIGESDENYIDIDFGPDDYLWTVGNNPDIFNVDIEDGSITRFSVYEEMIDEEVINEIRDEQDDQAYRVDVNLRAVRYYEGKLYMGGRIPDGSENGSLEIWTMDINNGQASNPQQYLDLSEVTDEEFTIYALTFDANGKIYMGANSGTGIYTWNEEDGFNEFYPGLINPNGYSFAWEGEFLIASATKPGEETRFPLKIDVRREGAPYFGIE